MRAHTHTCIYIYIWPWSPINVKLPWIFGDFEQLPFIRTRCRRLLECRFIKKIFVAGTFQKWRRFWDSNPKKSRSTADWSKTQDLWCFWSAMPSSPAHDDFVPEYQMIGKMWKSCKIRGNAQNSGNAPKRPGNRSFLVLLVLFWSFRWSAVDFWSADL